MAKIRVGDKQITLRLDALETGLVRDATRHLVAQLRGDSFIEVLGRQRLTEIVEGLDAASKEAGWSSEPCVSPTASDQGYSPRAGCSRQE